MGELEVSPTAIGIPNETEGADARPIPRRGPGLRPALVVVGIAVFILVLFGIGSALNDGTSTSRTTPGTGPSVPSGPTAVAGTTLLAQPAARALAPIVQPGTPPDNIVDSLALPVGATRVTHSPSRSVTLFDASERFTVPATQAAVIDFYKSELKAMTWKISDVGPATGVTDAIEVLAQKAGTDGWYWEVGAVVSPTTFGASGSAAGFPTGTTPFELRLFQVNDPD